MTEVENAIVPLYPDPGMQLRRARERAGVSLKQISDITLISVARLEALENEDFNRVGGVAYVTGYTRAYARVVGVASEQLVKSFEALLGVEKQVVEHTEIHIRRPRKSLPFGRIAAVLSLVLIILVLAWKYLERESVNGSRPPSVSESVPSLPAVKPAPVLSETKPEGATAVLSQSSVEAISEPSPVMDIDVMDTDSAETDLFDPDEGRGGALSVDTSDTAMAGDDRLDEVRLEESQSRQKPDLVEQEQTEITVDTPDLLILNFTDECWLEVKDTSGQVKIAQTVQSGDNLQLFGLAPFELMLGNARAADVALNGQLVNVPIRAGRKTLRFTVGN